MRKLETMCESKVSTIAAKDCIIVDAIAVIEVLLVPSTMVNVTFVDMTEQFCDNIHQLCCIYESVSQIHIVPDRYEEILRTEDSVPK